MHIRKITLRNWMRYRGVHDIVLGPGVHAVVASHVRDLDRSNWLGKTALFDAIRYALFGGVRYDRADRVVSEGEESCAVQLTLSDGTDVVREHGRRSPQRLMVQLPGEARGSTGDAAEAALGRVVGLTRRQFEDLFDLGQRTHGELATTTSGKRLDAVSAWLSLGELDEAEERASDGLEAAGASVEAARVALLAVERELDAHAVVLGLKRPASQAWAGEASDRVDKASVAAADAASAVRALEGKLRDQGGWWRDLDDSVAYEKLVLAVREAENKAHALWNEDRIRKLAQAAQGLAEAAAYAAARRGEVDRLAAASSGRFDGRCPVACFSCPVADQVVAEARRNGAALADARASADEAAGVERAWLERVERLQAARAKAAELHVRVAAKASEIERLRKGYERIQRDGPPPDDEALEEQLDEARDQFHALTTRAEELEASYRALLAALAKLEQCSRDAKRAAERLDVERTTSEVLSRARRRYAAGAVGAIAAQANQRLAEAGVSLTISASWATPASKDLTPSCLSCGSRFNRGNAQKACPRCGAERGPRMIERFDLRLSDDSGAAEDLAGVALRLSAASFVRAERGSAWGVALFDEPFGHLDRAHRRGLASHLTAMLASSYGFEQAFVISHTADVVAALPHRVELLADDERTWPAREPLDES